MRSHVVPLLAVALFVSPQTAGADEIRDTSGHTDERVVSISQVLGKTVIKTDKRATVPLDSVKEIDFEDVSAEEPGSSAVILANGDVLRGEIGKGGADSFELETPFAGKVKVRLDLVAGILHEVSAEREHRLVSKFLGKLTDKGFDARPTEKDVLVLKNAQAKTTGDLGSVPISSKGVQISTFKTTVPLDQVEGIFPNAAIVVERFPGPPPGKTVVRLRCADGSLLTGVVKSLDANTLELEHGLGTLPVARGEVRTLLVEKGGLFTYLSDMVPVKVAESFPDGFERDDAIYGWKRDAEVVSGERLSLGGRVFEKGLGVHSRCSLTFNLGKGAWGKFRAFVGLDDRAARMSAKGGSAVFRVLVDGKPAKEIGAGLTKRTGEAPTEIEIDVAGAKVLELVVDCGDALHILGRADWADAYLVK